MPREGPLAWVPPGHFLCAPIRPGRGRGRVDCVRTQPRARLILVAAALAFATGVLAQETRKSDSEELTRQFQAAEALYHAGHAAEAAAQLEALLPSVPPSFAAEEMLGLCYGSLHLDVKATAHLQAAVNLEPRSATARTNLAVAFAHAGEAQKAEEQFRAALQLEPNSYTANRNLGRFYTQSGDVAAALPLLAAAQHLQPDSYDNGYDLALAESLTGHLPEAKQLAIMLLQQRNTAELHDLLAHIEEKDGNFVAAAQDFEAAAQMDPSEGNLFDWGSELLLHRTYEPAADVFGVATQKYPDSQRLWIGLGMSLYARGTYEEALDALEKAADVNPSDPRCYLFLFKAFDRSPSKAEGAVLRFKRYAELEPNNGHALYFYAASLWKARQLQGANLDLLKVEALLEKSIVLDPSLPEPHVELGALYEGQHAYDKSIPEYQRAVELNPNLAEARYHLGIDYSRTGDKERAQVEFALTDKLRAQQQAQVDKERAEVEQFIYTTEDKSPAKP